MKMRVALAAILLASCKVQDPAPEIAVEDAWARASVPGQPSAAVYFTVKNSGGEDELVSVSSSAGPG